MSRLEFNNVNVFNIESSILSAKFSTAKQYNQEEYDYDYGCLNQYLGNKNCTAEEFNRGEYLFNLASKLGSSSGGSGHDCFLKGITVNFTVLYPQHWTRQFQRYHFADIPSSSSLMKQIVNIGVDNKYVRYIDKRIIDILKEKISLYVDEQDRIIKKELFNDLMDNCPMGIILWMEVATNYLQLKSIFRQRKNHQLYAWNDFEKFISELPNFLRLTSSSGI